MSVWDDGSTPYTSEREWADAQIDRVRWASVCCTPLGSNLAVAGALCASFRAGDAHGWSMADHEERTGSQDTCAWRPGIGRPYCGSEPCTCPDDSDYSDLGPSCQFCAAPDVGPGHLCYGPLEDR